MEFAISFRDLEVYQLARELARDIFEVSKTFPREEMYSLTSQIRRVSRSTGAYCLLTTAYRFRFPLTNFQFSAYQKIPLTAYTVFTTTEQYFP